MRVLVTGATGQVGRAVSWTLAEQGHDAVSLSRGTSGPSGAAEHVAVDVGAPDSSERVAAATARCDAIVHAAAAIDGDPHSPAVALTNCLGTQQLLRLAERWEVEGFVYMSSVPVIGRPRLLPIDEDHPVDPPTAYHASKLYGEQLCELARRRGVRTAALRLTSPVGPGTPSERILGAFVRRALSGEPLEVLGEGTRRQDYVDVRDVAVAVGAALSLGAEGCFNVARGESVSNLELADACVRVVGSDAPVVTGSRPDPEEGARWDVSIARAATTLGYSPRYTIEDSIAAAADGLESA